VRNTDSQLGTVSHEHNASVNNRIEHVTTDAYTSTANCAACQVGIAPHAAFPACVSSPHSKALTRRKRLAIVHGVHEESLHSLTWSQLGPNAAAK
jgi:hypothetical protein